MSGDAAVVSRDPWTNAVVHRCLAASSEQVERAVGRAEASFAAWSTSSFDERAFALRTFAHRLRTDAAELADLVVAEVGKLRADALAEVEWTARSADFYAEHPPSPRPSGGARVHRRPVGVVAAITPWNVPLVTPAWKWLPALMAGNAVVWKPSELATGIAAATHERLLASGIPPDVFQLVPGAPEVARSLSADERVSVVHFTGSEAAGRALAAIVGPRLGRCALELSGLNVALVFPDADLDHAADCIIACATALSGQKCTATRRVLVHDQVRQPLIDRLAEQLAALRPGDPRNPDTSIGPLITPSAAAWADQQLQATLDRGSRLVARSPQGSPAPGGSMATRAALLSDLPAGDPLRTTELFAPVLSVDSFADTEDAWRQANASPYGLSAAVYTHDPELLAQAPERLRTGVVMLNRRGDDVELQAPFGGHKRSGNGHAEGGEWVYASLTDAQAVYGTGSG